MRQLLTTVWVCAVIGGTAAAQAKTISRKELPPAVERTVETYSRDATITRLSTEIEQGHRIFELALAVDGHSKDISIDAAGNVLEIEQEVTLTELPIGVQRALRLAAGKGTLGKIESLTKAGRLVAYEAVVTAGRRRREIQVGPDGERVPHRE